MALTAFRIIKFKDNYVFTNTGIVPVTIRIERLLEDCLMYEVTQADIVVAPSEQRTIVLAYDGQYKLFLIDENNEASEIKVLHYLSLINSILSDIQYILCDCAEDSNCPDCTHAGATAKELSTVLRIFSYISLTHPQYTAFLAVVFESLKCSVDELTRMLVSDELMTGKGNYVELLKKILSFYYLAFYYSEIKSSSIEELDYLNTKFQFTELSTCIDAELLADVQLKINNMATFTVISGTYINQPPIVGDNTIEVPNRVTTKLNLDQFTSQTTPPYFDPEGDIVDALRVDSIAGTNQGVYQYDNTPISIGLVIPAQHIIDGRLVHVGADTNTVVNDYFGFSLRDIGSMTWVS